MDASSEMEARVKLRAQKIVPIKVSVKGMEEKKAGFDLANLFKPKAKVKGKELQIFSRQFSTMISSGIPIVQALDILVGQTKNPGFRETIRSIKNNLEAGKRLGECLAAHPAIFDTMFVSMVKAGEEGGVLDTILNRLASYLEKNAKIGNKVKGAMWYPAAITIVAGIVVIALLKFVIPKFAKIFTAQGQKLPALTQMVVDASDILQAHFFLIIIAIGGIIFGIKYYYGTKEGKIVFDKVFITLPIFGTLIQKSAIARFTRNMSTKLSRGVGILDSLEVCSTVTGNVVIESAIMRSRKAISDGKSIVQPLSLEKYIPGMVVQMIGVGEATGTMDSMFAKIADFYEEEVDFAVTALTSVMEPIMMVFLGGIIAVVVIAMYLPIFNMGNAIK